MINENIEEKPKKSNDNFWIKILIVLLVACFLFMCLQTIYLFALSTGRAGIMTYNSIPDEDDKDDSDKVNKEKDDKQKYDFVNDPYFSLEDAASVYNPDKETLTTMEIVDAVSPATVSLFIVDDGNGTHEAVSSGTGFIISEDGYIVTNAHVIDSVLTEENYSIMVKIPGNDDMVEAKISGTDEQTDIAVIKIPENEDSAYPSVTLGDSDTLMVGELVVAIGNSLGTLDGTVTVGVVSALDREVNDHGYSMHLIQTDASINSGNSGGPLINSYGEVIGVTNAKMSSAEGLGFAIPITSVKSVIQSIINYGYVVGRPFLGISVATIGSDEYFGAVDGVYVAELEEGGPGEAAGILVGDKILEIDGVEITISSDIIDVRDAHKPGDEVVFVIDRNGEIIELTLVIGDSNSANES